MDECFVFYLSSVPRVLPVFLFVGLRWFYFSFGEYFYCDRIRAFAILSSHRKLKTRKSCLCTNPGTLFPEKALYVVFRKHSLPSRMVESNFSKIYGRVVR
eukprot:PhF_6_TR8258/c0_g1_i1/m.12561